MSAIVLGIGSAACYDLFMPGYVGKLLFPRASPGARRRKLRALRWWAVAVVFIVAAVVGLLYAAYQQARH
ncbi:MAG: hypothetical protein ABSD29_01730 [Verrucomicrobiota bacterium]|jgi:hypothetical protein